MSNIDDLNKDLDRLSELRAQISATDGEIRREEAVLTAPLKIRKAALDKLKQDYETLREEVLFQLRLNRMESWKNDKITAYVTEKPKMQIEEPGKVAMWLKQNGFALDEYMTRPELDASRIASLQQSKLKEDGEIIDGVKFEVQEVLTVRDRSKK